MSKKKKYCTNCSNEISEDAVVCPSCGVKVGAPVYNVKVVKGTSNDLAIVGFVLALVGIFMCFFSLAGLIVSIIAYKNCNDYVNPNKGFAIAGIVISAIVLVLGVISALAGIILPIIVAIIATIFGLAM